MAEPSAALQAAYDQAKAAGAAWKKALDAKVKADTKAEEAKQEVRSTKKVWDQHRASVQALEKAEGVGYYGTGEYDEGKALIYG